MTISGDRALGFGSLNIPPALVFQHKFPLAGEKTDGYNMNAYFSLLVLKAAQRLLKTTGQATGGQRLT